MHLHVPGAGPAGCAGFTAPAPPAAVLQPAALRPHCRMAAPALLTRSGLIKAVNGRQDSLSFVLGHEVRRFRHRRRLLCRPCGRACCLCLLSPRASAHACRLPRCLQVGHAIGRHRCVCGGLGQLTGRALQGMPCPSRRRLPATCPHTLCVQPGEGRADVQRHVCGRCVGGRGRAPAQGEARPLPRSAAGRSVRCWPCLPPMLARCVSVQRAAPGRESDAWVAGRLKTLDGVLQARGRDAPGLPRPAPPRAPSRAALLRLSRRPAAPRHAERVLHAAAAPVPPARVRGGPAGAGPGYGGWHGQVRGWNSLLALERVQDTQGVWT